MYIFQTYTLTCKRAASLYRLKLAPADLKHQKTFFIHTLSNLTVLAHSNIVCLGFSMESQVGDI